MPYEAFYVPSVPSDHLEVAMNGGGSAQAGVRRPVPGVDPGIVLGYKDSIEGRLAAMLAPPTVPFHTPRSRVPLPAGSRRVLTVWPGRPEVLTELAQRMAEGSRLVMIGRSDADLGDWVGRQSNNSPGAGTLGPGTRCRP